MSPFKAGVLRELGVALIRGNEIPTSADNSSITIYTYLFQTCLHSDGMVAKGLCRQWTLLCNTGNT
jgi:hypothetical protein